MEYFKIDKNRAFLISQKAIIIEDGKLLILKNNEKKSNWELPGGILEIDENLEKGLKRELVEEIGLKIKIEKLLVVGDSWHNNFKFIDGRLLDVKFITIGYLCKKGEGEIKLSEEHRDFMWAVKNDIKKLDFGPKTTSLIKQIIKMDIIK